MKIYTSILNRALDDFYDDEYRSRLDRKIVPYIRKFRDIFLFNSIERGIGQVIEKN